MAEMVVVMSAMSSVSVARSRADRALRHSSTRVDNAPGEVLTHLEHVALAETREEVRGDESQPAARDSERREGEHLRGRARTGPQGLADKGRDPDGHGTANRSEDDRPQNGPSCVSRGVSETRSCADSLLHAQGDVGLDGHRLPRREITRSHRDPNQNRHWPRSGWGRDGCELSPGAAGDGRRAQHRLARGVGSQRMSILRYAARYARGTVLWAIVFGTVGGAMTAWIVALIGETLRTGAGTSAQMLTFATLAVAGCGLRFVSSDLLTRFSQRHMLEMSQDLTRRVVDSGLRNVEELGSARLLATLTEDIALITTTISAMPLVVANLAVVVACFLYVGVPVLDGVCPRGRMRRGGDLLGTSWSRGAGRRCCPRRVTIATRSWTTITR